MAGFPLGGANQEEIPPTPFLFCQQEISLKGFELWKLQQQQQQLGHFSDTRKYGDEYEDKFILNINPSMAGSSSHMAIVGEERQSGSNSCQDCGNQAKKDCVHMRCRTCCQSRGFHCPTHVKSTWVPASRRRERQQQLATLHQLTQIPPKRLRNPDPTSSSLACTRITEPGSFPVEVNSPAVFRCVKVSSIDEGDDQYAYQTAVSIGGHVFRGILYDQGPENLTSGDDGGRNFINPTTASATNTSIALINPAATLYPPPLNAFMAGTQFFTHPRP